MTDLTDALALLVGLGKEQRGPYFIEDQADPSQVLLVIPTPDGPDQVQPVPRKEPTPRGSLLSLTSALSYAGVHGEKPEVWIGVRGGTAVLDPAGQRAWRVDFTLAAHPVLALLVTGANDPLPGPVALARGGPADVLRACRMTFGFVPAELGTWLRGLRWESAGTEEDAAADDARTWGQRLSVAAGGPGEAPAQTFFTVRPYPELEPCDLVAEVVIEPEKKTIHLVVPRDRATAFVLTAVEDLCEEAHRDLPDGALVFAGSNLR